MKKRITMLFVVAFLLSPNVGQSQSAWFDRLMIRAGSESPIRAELGWNTVPLNFTVGTVQWYREGRPKIYEYFAGIGHSVSYPGGVDVGGDLFASYAQDSWYLQGWLAFSLRSGGIHIFARGATYEPLEDQGIRQLLLDESGVMFRMTDIIEFGGTAVAHRYDGENAAWAIGPALRLTWPDNKNWLTVEYLKRRDNLSGSDANPDLRVTYRMQTF